MRGEERAAKKARIDAADRRQAASEANQDEGPAARPARGARARRAAVADRAGRESKRRPRCW